MSQGTDEKRYLTKTLIENWRRETEAAQLYEFAAQSEHDERKRKILHKLAEVEYNHAKLWVQKLEQLGVDANQLPKVQVEKQPIRGVVDLVDRIEAIEQGNAAWYQSLRNVVQDDDIVRIINQIEADETAHADLDAALKTSTIPGKRLKRMWGEERWHKQQSGGWVGDAIYGVNDGLGAIFGIIAGVAGFTEHSASSTHTVLVSGFFGALASTLSMGAGAYLATKSENELMESEIAQERREIEQDPEHEIEELALIYQLKGFEPIEATRIATQIASDPEQFLKTMSQEELGFHESTKGNPWKSAIFGSVSTLVGGIIPLIPFFFVGGLTGMLIAAVVSILAHFAVGAAKSIITTRSWWASGLEMTLVGVIVGVVSYALGVFGSQLFMH